MIDLSKILDNPFANKLNPLVDFTQFASTALQEYVVRPEEENLGVAGFRFQIVGNEAVNVSSDITDHWLESNITAQDHIALKPEIITLTGYVGELVDAAPEEIKEISKEADRLTTLSPFLPSLTVQAQSIYDQVERAYRTYEKANQTVEDIFNKYKASGLDQYMNSQQFAFATFYDAWRNRQLFSVQTPYAVFTSMAIQSLKAEQDESTRLISSFELTLKKVRITQNIQTQKTTFQGRASYQVKSQVDKGVQKPLKSTLKSGVDMVKEKLGD